MQTQETQLPTDSSDASKTPSVLSPFLTPITPVKDEEAAGSSMDTSETLIATPVKRPQPFPPILLKNPFSPKKPPCPESFCTTSPSVFHFRRHTNLSSFRFLFTLHSAAQLVRSKKLVLAADATLCEDFAPDSESTELFTETPLVLLTGESVFVPNWKSLSALALGALPLTPLWLAHSLEAGRVLPPAKYWVYPAVWSPERRDRFAAFAAGPTTCVDRRLFAARTFFLCVEDPDYAKKLCFVLRVCAATVDDNLSRLVAVSKKRPSTAELVFVGTNKLKKTFEKAQRRFAKEWPGKTKVTTKDEIIDAILMQSFAD